MSISSISNGDSGSSVRTKLNQLIDDRNLVEVLHPSGGDDTTAIQAAVDAHDIVLLGSGDFTISDSIDLRSGTTLRGMGMYQTTINYSEGFVALDATARIEVSIEDMAITQNADPAYYDIRGGYAISFGGGTGSSTACKRCSCTRVFVHDTYSAGITSYAGLEDFTLTECRLERTGRGSVTGNGWRRCKFINNYFGQTGDDGIGGNGHTHNCTIAGNVFHDCGALGVTPASAIKIHGVGNAITGNAFHECYTGVSLKSHHSFDTSEDDFWATNKGNVISGNTFYSSAARQDGEGIPVGIEVRDCDGLVITGNYIRMIGPDGNTNPFLSFKNCRGIQSSNNVYIGKWGEVLENIYECSFNHDTFQLLRGSAGSDWRDIQLWKLNASKRAENIKMIDCQLGSQVGCLFQGYSSSFVSGEVRGTRITEPTKIAWPVTGPSGTISSITLKSIEQYAGLIMNIADGSRLYLANRHGREELIVNGAHDIGDTTLNFAEVTLTGTYVTNYCWIEYGNFGSRNGAYHGISDMSSGATCDLKFDDNEFDDWYVGEGAGTTTITTHTVATLPNAPINVGRILWCSDADAGSAATVASDGTNWRVIHNNNIAASS